MSSKREKFYKHCQTKAKYIRISRLVISAFLIISFLLTDKITFSADAVIFPYKFTLQFINPAAAQEPKFALTSNVITQSAASRLKIIVGETRDITVEGAAETVLVVSPEIASARIISGRVLSITALKIGETILIINSDGKRQTLIVEVSWKPPVSRLQNPISIERSFTEKAKMSGSYNIAFTSGSEQNPTLVRNRFDLRRKLSDSRTLRASGEMYKFFGSGSGQKEFDIFQNYGLDRVSLGVDLPDKTIDFLDSQVRISPVISNAFEMRGFHLAENPKLSKNPGSPHKGIEIFAGLTRPVSVFYDKSRSKLIGAMFPLANNDSWQVRAGFISVIAPKNFQGGRGGTVFQLNGSYAPNKKFSADAEIGLANNSLSWGARLNLKFEKFGALAEFSRVDKNSPLANLNTLSGGRQTEAVSVYWRPNKELSFSAKYNHAKIERLANPAFADFHRSTFSANASFRPDKNSRFSFRFADRQIETAASGSSSKFQIASRAYTAGYHVRFNQHFSNDFEAGIKFSREANVKSEIETGFNLREQLRFSWRKNSLTGFFNYTNRTTSLISLIMLNPHLLPVELQPVYALNPAQFLQFHRDRLAYLLPGIVVPQTRNLDAGVRLQTTATRFRLTGEARYGTSAFYSQNQKNLFTSVGVDFRLDAANSIQINGWHSFGANSQQAIVFGFSHRFGSGGGGGFQFSKLFGLNKGKITGRVFEDLNGDGVENSGEIGVSGLIIKLNEKRSIKTDAKGRFQFSTNEGVYNITLVSEDLGVRMQATTAIERKISLDSGQTVNVNFGVSGFGFIAGRVFNESNLAVENPVAKIRGIESVCLLLRSLEPESKNVVATQTSGSGGAYEFRNIRPGKYLLEIDSATLPANFRLPAQSSWEVTVLPLQGFYLDIPFAAQRAVTGFVFIDIDGDGKFDRQRDEPVEGAFITANGVVAVSDSNGAYILRNLPAGKIKMAVRVSTGTESLTVFVEFGAEPATKRAVNFAVAR